jgi:uncharacterized membrane protein YgdD (TMEM256/DUF423 family)
MERVFFTIGAVLGALGVGAGAFGAHALKTRLAPDMLAVFETGARYQLWHALAIIAAAWAWSRWPSPVLVGAGWLFIVGIVLFSGSLYILSVTGIRFLGIITPFGGVALILGWLALAWGVWRQR